MAVLCKSASLAEAEDKSRPDDGSPEPDESGRGIRNERNGDESIGFMCRNEPISEPRFRDGVRPGAAASTDGPAVPPLLRADPYPEEAA